MKLLSKVYMICILYCMTMVSAFWDGNKWWFIEHHFKLGYATFEINKIYQSNGFTKYDFKLKDLPEDKGNLRVAFQWLRSDDTYQGMFFELRVPEKGPVGFGER